MEEQNTKPSKNGKHTGISNGQKWILVTPCLLIFFVPIVFIVFRDGENISDFFYPLFGWTSTVISTYYTLLIYMGTYSKSKYNWITLTIVITCIFIQSLAIVSNKEQMVLKIVIALIYISSAVSLYKWWTVGKPETRWIPFLIAIFAWFFFNVFWLILMCNV